MNQTSTNQDFIDDENIPKSKKKEGKYYDVTTFVWPLINIAYTTNTIKFWRYCNA